MKIVIIGLLFIFTSIIAQAKPSIGLTTLMYKRGVATPTVVSESNLMQKFVINHQSINTFNQTIIDEVNRQYGNINYQVKQNLNRESRTFSLFDGEPILKEWQRGNPHIFESFTSQWVALNNGEEITESALPKNNSRQYILVGTLVQINQAQNNAILGNSRTISLLYNLDLTMLYLIIDANNQKVVAQFAAFGHGGFSAFESSYQTPVNYNPNDIVKMAIENLSSNIVHNILKIERFK